MSRQSPPMIPEAQEEELSNNCETMEVNLCKGKLSNRLATMEGNLSKEELSDGCEALEVNGGIKEELSDSSEKKCGKKEELLDGSETNGGKKEELSDCSETMEVNLCKTSFYGKDSGYNPFVKVKRLPDSVLQNDNNPRVSSKKNVRHAVLGSQVTRHGIKKSKKANHSSKRKKSPHENDSVKSGESNDSSSVVCVTTDDEGSTTKAQSESPKSLESSVKKLRISTRRKASKFKTLSDQLLAKAPDSPESESTGRKLRKSTNKKTKISKAPPKVREPSPEIIRIRPGRRGAASEASKKINKALNESEDETSDEEQERPPKNKKKEPVDSDFEDSSGCESDDYDPRMERPSYRAIVRERKEKANNPSKMVPQYSDYEIAAQERTAERLKFLKSLEMENESEKEEENEDEDNEDD